MNRIMVRAQSNWTKLGCTYCKKATPSWLPSGSGNVGVLSAVKYIWLLSRLTTMPPKNVVNKPQKFDPVCNMHVVSHDALDVFTSTHKITCLDHVLLVKLCETDIESSIINLYKVP